MWKLDIFRQRKICIVYIHLMVIQVLNSKLGITLRVSVTSATFFNLYSLLSLFKFIFTIVQKQKVLFLNIIKQCKIFRCKLFPDGLIHLYWGSFHLSKMRIFLHIM